MSVSLFITLLTSLTAVGAMAIVGGSFLGIPSQIRGYKPAPRRLRRNTSHVPNFLLFVHPRCPNTLATVRQLRHSLQRTSREYKVRMIVLCPPGTSESWYETEIVREARLIDGLEIVLDYGGSLSKRYGAFTSGTLLIYNENSNLVFQGGITPSAGHEGDCPGSQSISEALEGGCPEHRNTAVYGCRFFEDK